MLSTIADIASIVGAILVGCTFYFLLVARRWPLRIDRISERSWTVSSQRDGGTIVLERLINQTDYPIERYHGDGVVTTIKPKQSLALGITLGPSEHFTFNFLLDERDFKLAAKPQGRIIQRKFDLVALPNDGKR